MIQKWCHTLPKSLTDAISTLNDIEPKFLTKLGYTINIKKYFFVASY